MAENSLGYFYDFLGLSDLKIHYDFSALSGSAVPSVSPALSVHSGVPSSVSLLSGSGLLNQSSSIKISNIDPSFNTFGTHIFNYERTGALGSGLLFSSLRTGILNSGYQIGLTDSNLLFFQYIGANGPVVVNSDIILGDKNAIAVLVGNNSVSFNYYNFNTKAFESDTRTISSNELLFSDQWEIRGVGNTLGNYLYFNKNIPTNNLTRFFSGFYSSPTGFPATSGSFLYSEISAYTPTVGSFNEGNFTFAFSGFDSEFFALNAGQFGDPVFWGEINNAFLVSGSNFSGIQNIPSGSYAALTTGTTGNFTGDYFPFYFGDITNVQVYSGGANYPYSGQISGYFVVFETNQAQCAVNPVFNTTTNEPIISISGPIAIPVQRTGFYEITPAFSGNVTNSGVLSSYGMSRVTYLWQTGSDGIEQIVFTGGISTPTNKRTAVFDLVKGEFASNGFYPSGNSNWFLNGVYQTESGYTVGGNVFNPILTKIADYFSEDQYFNTNGFALSQDLSVYDYEQQQNRIILPANYASGVLVSGSSFNLSGKTPYLNGQRLISGEDFTYSGTTFRALGALTGVGGNLVFVNNYTGEYRMTGSYNYTGSNLPKFSRGSSLFYLNGVRLNESLKVEHSRFDKISGNYVYDDTSVPILTSSDPVF